MPGKRGEQRRVYFQIRPKGMPLKREGKSGYLEVGKSCVLLLSATMPTLTLSGAEYFPLFFLRVIE